MNTRNLYTTARIAEILGIHEKTAQRLCRSGEIKSMRIGREYRVRPEWLDDYIERCAVMNYECTR